MKVYAIILSCLLAACVELGDPVATSTDLNPVDIGGPVAPETTLEDKQGEPGETVGKDATRDVTPEVTYDEESMPPMPSYPVVHIHWNYGRSCRI